MTPYVGFSNDTLDKQLKAVEGQEILCPQCNELHKLECGEEIKEDGTREKSTLLMFYSCGGKSYLGAVAGRLTVRVKSDVSGKVEL